MYLFCYVLDDIIEVVDIFYIISGKKLEVLVKKILFGYLVEKVVNCDVMCNLEALDFFIDFVKWVNG